MTDEPVLIYDGRCRFCAGQATRLQRWVRGRVRLESFRDPGVIERYPGLTEEACDQALQLVEPNGRIWSGGAAVARALRLNPMLAPLGWLYFVPGLRWLSDRIYGVIARNRFRLQGEVCTDDTCSIHQPREPPSRARIRDLFLRLFGVIFLIAFLSVFVQINVLIGSRGLLPACDYVRTLSTTPFWQAPTVFRFTCSDTALHGAAFLGAVLSFGLILNIAPRYCLCALWLLYMSFVTAGQIFCGFQWDNLLLESAFFTLFVTPAGFRPKRPPSPHPIAVFLMLWLVFRLHVESGAAKLLTGDPSWRNLTAMVSYYETAPLPTWVGWYVHQMPVWAHKACALFTFVVELGVPLFMWGSRRVRLAAFTLMMAMQVSVILTANYGFFNYLSMALCLFVLDDGHLSWMAARFGRQLSAPAPRRFSWLRTALLTALSLVLVPISIILFLPFFHSFTWLNRELSPLRRDINTLRSVNIYHLFASMTLVRREVVIEGSDDGIAWQPYEFCYKPGDPLRPPPFVAPHQPRVDFQLWFLLLGGPPREQYFNNLVERLFHAPDVVAPLFCRNPFPDKPPQRIRLAFYRYTFTDPATRRATGAWWHRDLQGYSKVLTAEAFRK